MVDDHGSDEGVAFSHDSSMYEVPFFDLPLEADADFFEVLS